MDLANLRGGPDNITIIIVKIHGETYITNHQVATPLVIGKTTEPARPLHPAVLVTSIVLGLAGLLLITMQPLIGIGVLAAGIAAALVGFALGRAGIESGETLAPEFRFGSGPHTQSDCLPNQQIMQSLGETANEIRKLAQRHPNKFNWAPFDEAFVESTEQLQSGKFAQSFGNIAKAITYIMSEFRK